MSPSKAKLRALSENIKKNRYKFGPINPKLLERFDYGVGMGALKVEIEIPEFTTLCPITGQPDYGTLRIEYEPSMYCVESKSLKLYLMSYRQAGSFHEQCVLRIGRDLERLLRPNRLRVEGKFGARGGIAINPVFATPDETL